MEAEVDVDFGRRQLLKVHLTTHPQSFMALFILESTSLDIKSIALNIFSILLFLLPFAAYFYEEYLREALMVVGGSMVISVIAPPIGFRRPHPYSDDPNNMPFGKKSS